VDLNIFCDFCELIEIDWYFVDVVRLNLDKLDNLKKAKAVLRTKVQKRWLFGSISEIIIFIFYFFAKVRYKHSLPYGGQCL